MFRLITSLFYSPRFFILVGFQPVSIQRRRGVDRWAAHFKLRGDRTVDELVRRVIDVTPLSRNMNFPSLMNKINNLLNNLIYFPSSQSFITLMKANIKQRISHGIILRCKSFFLYSKKSHGIYPFFN